MTTQVLVPISSRSLFFPPEEYYFPKPLVEVAGQPMIEVVVRQLRREFPGARFFFVVDRDDVREFSIDRIIRYAAGQDSVVIERHGPTAGALCSCLLAVDELDPAEPLVVANSDQVIDAGLRSICRGFGDATAGVVTFASSHPRWSYVALDESDHVVQAVEKRVISKTAVAGFYYFATARDFVDAAQAAIASGAETGGNYFISAALNEVLLAGGRIAHADVDPGSYHSFYSPDRIGEFERSSFAQRLRHQAEGAAPSVNVVVPAGGLGSRFADAGWRRPKPFIDVDGEMMLSRVLRNVRTRSGTQTLVLRREHLDDLPEAAASFEAAGVGIVPVSRLTEGTACTVLLARPRFDGDNPLLVANSDQLVDFDVDDFVRDCLDRDLDGSILVFQDRARDPKWSFARLDERGLVAEVAEKKPISDLATVGIYLFRRGSDFVRAAADMIARNERVNGEFYTCPVYNHMIAAGQRIGVYEVPGDAMHGLGTPEDLRTHLQAAGAPDSADAPLP